MPRSTGSIDSSQPGCHNLSSDALDDQLLTVKDVMARLQLGRTKVYNLAGTGQIRNFKIGGDLRFTRQAVVDFLNDCATQYGVSR
jgi:excisionase family DNA binding protein